MAEDGTGRAGPAPVVRRGPGSVQLGVDPAHAVVVEGLTPAEADLVVRGGLPAQGVRREQLDALLTAAGRPRTAPTRPRARVVVDGCGPLAEALARGLRRAGLRDVVAGAYALEAAPAAWLPDLVVLPASPALALDRAHAARALGRPVLLVTVDGPTATVGPYLRPGASACAVCLDLHRRDADPGWEVVRETVSGASVAPERPLPAPDGPLLDHVVATATLLALAALEGRCPAGVALESRLPWPATTQRRWRPHPRCDCPAGRSLPGPAAASVTMTG